ncbi:MAG TPA: VOC family protein, partial [Albitalea sp.]
METLELHRGRLIDHVQLVVRDLAASQRFYAAVFEVLGIPMSGTGER